MSTPHEQITALQARCAASEDTLSGAVDILCCRRRSPELRFFRLRARPHHASVAFRHQHRRAFTLVELLVATTVLAIIIGIVLKITNQTSQIWSRSTSKIQAFQEARAAFESMTRSVSQATLRTYYDYYNSSYLARRDLPTAQLATFVPSTYDRISDLHFISGQAQTLLTASPAAIVTQTHALFFQAPLGFSEKYTQLESALNATGYYIAFGSDANTIPPHVASIPRYRFRLMEMMQGTESLDIFANGPSVATANAWFTKNAATQSRVLAENIIALVLLPKLSDGDDAPDNTGAGVTLSPNYNYNSRIPLGAAQDPHWPGANPAFPGDGFRSYPASGGQVDATRHHQLPPILRIAMIAIDEPSAAKLQASDGTSVPSAIDFRNAGLFVDAKLMEADIRKVEDVCNAVPGNITGNTLPLTYRVFNNDILMREAKWSKN